MKRIFILAYSLMLIAALAACSTNGNDQQSVISPDLSIRQIQITTAEGNKVVFQLNDSPAANDLYQQLPLSIEVEDYAGSEKIFYPPEKLSIDDTPMAQGPEGTLAYYEPWGNVAVFYGECGGSSGLYELGEAIEGTEWIEHLSGKIQIGSVDTIPPVLRSAETADTLPQDEQPETFLSKEASTLKAPENIPEGQTQQFPAEVSGKTAASQEAASEISAEEDMEMKMKVQIGDAAFLASLEQNATVAAFMELMKNEPVVIEMDDYSGFEKVGSLGAALPSSNGQTTARSGDIVLYNGNQIVIFYGSNSWSYTRIGKIDDLSGWAEALGDGSVTVTFSIE